MPTDLKIPNLGENVTSADVLEVLVAIGDQIRKDQGIVELETDKATMIVPSTAAGVVTQIHCSPGQTVAVGAVVVTIEATVGEAPPAPAKPAVAPVAAVRPQPAVEPTVPLAPVVPKPSTRPVIPVAPQPMVLTESSPTTGSLVAAGPAIRRFAREVGVDLDTVHGTGVNGRIIRDDVLKVVREGSKSGNSTRAQTGGQSDGHGPVHVEKMPKIRQTIARKMHESWTTCPRVTNFDDADITALDEIRKNSKTEYAAKGINLTTMPFLIKALAMSLKTHPLINASVDMEAGQIIYKDYVNIGVAVDTDRGLVVPVLREADKLSIPEIARQLGDLADAVRDNNFTVEQLRGGTFSISNLGAIGGTYSTPIINIPETAILLVGRSRKMPIVLPNDQIAVRLMMPLSLSYDHRLIDGGAAARFLNDVIAYLQAPSRLLLAL